MPTTLQPLRELSDLLMQVHGQHEHQSLLKSDQQRVMLDRYAGHLHLVDQVRVLFDEWQQLTREISDLRQLTEDRQTRSEFLTFQLRELDELHLTQNEFQSLDLEHKQLAHAGELLQNINLALGLIAENDEQNTLHLLNQALQALETVQRVDPKIGTWIESIRNTIIQVSDTEDELRHYLNGVDLDPERLQWLEERISKIFDAARKHKVSPQDLFELQQKLTAEFSHLETSDERLVELLKKLETIEKNYFEKANQLSKSREKFSKKLDVEITKLIQELALPHGEFHIHLERDEKPRLAAFGLEKIIFQIKTNPGLSLQPLSKVASGGELSRISLAIHMATAEEHTVPTLVFDEVDVGIGGGIAETVGKLLRRLGKSHQVLCITHLPQVAAQGHHHLRVSKETQKNITQTKIELLSSAEKINELARMLGGVEITKKTREHAKEMLEKI